MTTLSPRARRRADESGAIHDGNARHVVELVAWWGLPRGQRVRGSEDVRFWFDRLDRAEVRTVADVWAHR